MRGDSLREGDVLARRYVLKQPVGAGGMSVVWRAWDSTLERTVAVKVLDGPIGTDGGQRDRIRREARAAARIEHPNAIAVYDYGETVTPRGRVAAYVVMQLLDGTSLAGRLVDGLLPWPEAVAVATTVADVLHAAHRRGVVHRDVTAENVMLTTDGVKLLDFGIAADIGQREEALTFGTPPYVAPERLVGAPASGSTDVYALGVLLYEMLTGAPPYPAASWDELEHVLAAGRRPTLSVPGLPPAVAAICLRCLATDPVQRPTAAEVATALATPAGTTRRRWWLTVVGVPLALGVVLAVLVLALQHDHAPSGDHAAPGPTVTIVISVPAPATVQPPPASSAPPGPPGPRGSAPSPSNGARPPSTPAPSPAPSLTPQAAGKAMMDIVYRRYDMGEIRDDVVEDIRNQVKNVIAAQADAPRLIRALHDDLVNRQREGSISEAAFEELEAALKVLSQTLT